MAAQVSVTSCLFDCSLQLATQFNVVQSMTMVNVPSLTATLLADHTYVFKGVLFANLDGTNGVKICLNGTCIASNYIQGGYVGIENTNGMFVLPRVTNLGAPWHDSFNVNMTRVTYFIGGSIVVSTAGTLGVYFAQHADTINAASSIIVGSSLDIYEVVQ